MMIIKKNRNKLISLFILRLFGKHTYNVERKYKGDPDSFYFFDYKFYINGTHLKEEEETQIEIQIPFITSEEEQNARIFFGIASNSLNTIMTGIYLSYFLDILCIVFAIIFQLGFSNFNTITFIYILIICLNTLISYYAHVYVGIENRVFNNYNYYKKIKSLRNLNLILFPIFILLYGLGNILGYYEGNIVVIVLYFFFCLVQYLILVYYEKRFILDEQRINYY